MMRSYGVQNLAMAQLKSKPLHILFFISLKAAITSTGFVLPVAFWISGSYINLVSLRVTLIFGVVWVWTYVNSHENIMKLQW